MLQQLITDNIDLWTSAETKRSTTGRGSNSKIELTGIKKLRELILELAVRGLLVPQDPNDEPASVLLEKIAVEKAQLIKDGKIKKKKQSAKINEDEKPFALPDHWEWVRLHNVAEANTGYAFKSREYTNKGTFVLRVTNIEPSGEINTLDSKYIDPIQAETTYNKFALNKNDVLLVMVGGSLGKVGIVNEKCLPAVLNQNMWRLDRFGELALRYFVMGVRYINATQIKVTQSTHGHLAQGEYLSKLFPLPPLAEQHRIVTKVDELMALCDQLEQQQLEHSDTHHTLVTTLLDSLCQAADNDQFQTIWSQLAANFDTLFTTEASIDQLKQTLLQLAVMGKLVPQDPNDEPASVLLEKIAAEKESLIKSGKVKKQKPLSEITENEMSFPLADKWKWVRLNDLFNIIVDCPHSTPKFLESGYLSLDTNSFKDGKLIKAKFRYVSKETFNDRNSRLQPKAGDIVFAREGSVGESVVIPEGIECCLGQRVMLFRGSNWLSPDFLRLTISSQGAIAKLLSLHKGIGAKHVNVRDMKNYVIAVPPTTEQHRIVAKADELMALCDQLKDRLNQAQTTQQQLAHAIVEQAVM